MLTRFITGGCINRETEHQLIKDTGCGHRYSAGVGESRGVRERNLGPRDTCWYLSGATPDVTMTENLSWFVYLQQKESM
jgi:hypothetical protein